ncbi:TRAP transporter small permease subunit [Marinivivus vitaminiproducens]|uniref:TRAP transporter small permease subunit n=1 Tax=Marinivivus vitaminiproducens TaxID=3035935 RepID=UPI00279F515A|nr:TRAP transporter small permease subunit [Geminicoccaceae bacterium SCSIO 64248]
MTLTPSACRLERAGRALLAWCAFPGRVAAWLVLAITAAVLVAVTGNAMRAGTLLAWNTDLPLLGTQLTMTGLFDLQWHLFAVLVILAGPFALAEDRHVRVDLVADRLSERGRAIVDLIGDLLLLLPFSALIVWLSLPFVGFAFKSGEGSDYGGLVDRYLIKAIIPVGFALLFGSALGRILVNVARLLDSRGSRAAGEG